MIEFKNVYIQYVKEFYSLYNFNCEISQHTLFVGDFYNGTNSIMRILAKIDKQYSGDCLVDNINLKDIKDKDLSIAYLPQTPILFKHKNLFYNLYFPLKIRKIKKNIAKNKINTLLNELNLNFINKKIKHMSKSEQKILCLIRAVLREQKYVLLENFFEDLDAEFISIAKFLIDKLKSNSTIIACEKDNIILEYYKDFEIVNLK